MDVGPNVTYNGASVNPKSIALISITYQASQLGAKILKN